jgi:hypothetical protein
MATKRKSKGQFLVRKVTVVRAAETGVWYVSSHSYRVRSRYIRRAARENQFPSDQQKVDASDIVKGYQVGKGEYIEIGPRRV